MVKSYSELIKLKSHSERLEYLKLLDNNAKSPRHMSSDFYKSDLWLNTRAAIIERDMGFDLGVFGVYINDTIIVHHINPMTPEDIELDKDWIYDPEYLICVSDATHKAIHYGDKSKLITLPKERSMNDTCPWKL